MTLELVMLILMILQPQGSAGRADGRAGMATCIHMCMVDITIYDDRQTLLWTIS
jgi:hypothetical protein